MEAFSDIGCSVPLDVPNLLSDCESLVEFSLIVLNNDSSFLQMIVLIEEFNLSSVGSLTTSKSVKYECEKLNY